MQNILEFIANEMKIDFSLYKESTISRRLKKRMTDLGYSNSQKYLSYLKKNSSEKKVLLETALIGVTRFFRDNSAYGELRENLKKQLAYFEGETFRVWSVGTATGEEAYSLAILLLDIFKDLNKEPKFKIFATDINPTSIQIARAGIYSAKKLASIRKSDRSAYFADLGDSTFQAKNNLKSHIVFSVHNILNDPPFIHINLVSCRNLLIYFKRDIQKFVFDRFKTSLEIHGILFLGKTESVNIDSHDFTPQSSEFKIFKLIDKSKRLVNNQILNRYAKGDNDLAQLTGDRLISDLKSKLINDFSHPYVFIDQQHRIIQKNGDTSLYLDLQNNVSNLNLSKMLPEELRSAFFHLITEVSDTQSSKRSHLIKFKRFDRDRFVVLEIKPYQVYDSRSLFFIVIFEAVSVGALSFNNRFTSSYSESETIKTLQDEVQILDEQLKSYQRNFEKVVSESRKLNEEIQAANEELKSTNEELESSNEELHTANEELYATNLELSTKNSEIAAKKAQLSESQRLFRILADNTQDIVSLHGKEGEYVYISPSAEEVSGYNVEELYKYHPFDIIHPDDLPVIKKSLETVIETGETQYSQYRYKFKSGQYNWMESFTKLVRNEQGEIEGILNTSRNIEKRITAENTLKLQTNYLNEILNSPTNLIVFSLDLNYRYKAFNKNHQQLMNKIWGVTIEVGTSILDYFSNPKSKAKAKNSFDRALNGEEFRYIEKYKASPTEHYVYENFYGPARNEHGDIEGITVFVTDITEIIESRRDLLEEKQRLLVTLRSIGDGVITTDVSGKIDLVNSIAEEILEKSRDELDGQDFDEVFKLRDYETRKRISTFYKDSSLLMLNEKVVKKFWLEGKNKSRKLISLRLSPIFDTGSRIFGAVIVFHDITDQEKMQRELLKSQKLESLGVLAGGIAHDFNNFLTGMLGHISLMKILEPDERDDLIYSLEATERASRRAQKLTKQLLTFSKGGNPIKETTFVEQHIKDAVEFSLRGSNIVAKYDFSQNVYQVDLDIGQFEQVIQNLAINAKQAMANGGTIFIKNQNYTVMKESRLPIKQGPYVHISFTDTGNGIEPEKISNVFDPFFTTKSEGSGLGLATSYSIINKHGGHISVSSEVGVGTTFNVYLPKSSHQVSEQQPKPNTIHKGSGVVIILDDEIMIQDVMKKMLVKLGYEVMITTNGDETIQLMNKVTKQGKQVEFVILDVTIPGGKGGLDILADLQKLQPDLKSIISSGYSNDEIISKSTEQGFSAFLPKPFSFNDFNQTILKILR